MSFSMNNWINTTESKTCSKCGVSKPLDEFNRNRNTKDGKNVWCKECCKEYNKEHYKEHCEEKKQYDKQYREEHCEEKRERDKQYCRDRGVQSMQDNKSCAAYLGVVIGERLVKHLFNDVVMMPYGHTGYDMICNKGKKIDVKTSCLRKRKCPCWSFHINKNTIADFFICVAFDNRDDLNPLHLWMIPGKELNQKGGRSISLSKIHKWDKWKRSIEEVQMCCTTMKE